MFQPFVLSHVLVPSEGSAGSETQFASMETTLSAHLPVDGVEGLQPSLYLVTWYVHCTAPVDQQASIATVIRITFYNTKN